MYHLPAFSSLKSYSNLILQCFRRKQPLARYWFQGLELALCGKAFTGYLLRDAGHVGGAHHWSTQGCLEKTLAALPYSNNPPETRPVAWAELHRVGETHPEALF